MYYQNLNVGKNGKLPQNRLREKLRIILTYLLQGLSLLGINPLLGTYITWSASHVPLLIVMLVGVNAASRM